MTRAQSQNRIRYRFLIAVLAYVSATTGTRAQSDTCVLVPEGRSTWRVLRCGSNITLSVAAGTSYQPDTANQHPSVQLQSGALLMDFHPTAKQRDFQVLTPVAIAAVRGTTWAVEVTTERSSTLVFTGRVAVRRRNGAGVVTLGPGQGVDVMATGPLTVRRWAPERVRALLARFGR